MGLSENVGYIPNYIKPFSRDKDQQNHWFVVSNIWVCLKMLCTPKPNGFADHYPYEKWLFHWEYTQHFQTNPYI